MMERVKALNVEREAEAQALGEVFLPLQIGVGLNTGNCVVGNMGSTLRFNYSVLGDAVNFTSRIEGQSKTYGIGIIAGASTIAAAAKSVAALELDLIRVKGKNEPEIVYGILGGPELAGSENFQRLVEINREMLFHYRRQNWAKAQDAIELLRPFAAAFGLEAFLDLYLDRIQEFAEHPPAADWNGAFIAIDK
jgi:adenylate cyclase